MKDEIKEIINLGHEAEKIEFSKGVTSESAQLITTLSQKINNAKIHKEHKHAQKLENALKKTSNELIRLLAVTTADLPAAPQTIPDAVQKSFKELENRIVKVVAGANEIKIFYNIMKEHGKYYNDCNININQDFYQNRLDGIKTRGLSSQAPESAE